jgi:autotransporter translocation and assembly factor TamB
MLTMNLDDRTFTLTQEATYKPEGRLELRGQLSILSGARSSDFGAKANDLRADLRVRWFL